MCVNGACTPLKAFGPWRMTQKQRRMDNRGRHSLEGVLTWLNTLVSSGLAEREEELSAGMVMNQSQSAIALVVERLPLYRTLNARPPCMPPSLQTMTAFCPSQVPMPAKGGYGGVLPLCQELGSLVPRSEEHAANNLVQEVSIMCHAAFACSQANVPPRCFDRRYRPRCVVDVGGGNGILAYLSSRFFVCDGIVVDAFVPQHRVEANVCAAYPYFRRVVKSIENTVWQHDIRYSPSDTVVVAKHLCGNGIDFLLRSMEAQSVWPEVLALATCCHMKGGFADYVNPSYLRKTLHIENERKWSCVANKTSWLQHERPIWMQQTGKLLETLIDMGRVMWLRERGYACYLVKYVSEEVTPRNNMVLAWRAPQNLLL